MRPHTTPRSELPDGHVVPRFAGISTFAHLPHTRDLRDVDVAVVGAPFDGGASFRSGQRFGPQKIREMSALLRAFNPALDVEPFAELRVVDWGDAACSPISIEDSLATIERAVADVVGAGVLPIVLGGDHSISLAILRALAPSHGPLGLVHFDAHPDTWETHFGRKYSHATPFRRAIEERLIDPSRYVQVGIRGPLPKASDLDDARALGITVLRADDVWEMGLDLALSRIHAIATGPVHVSLDIDVVDPAFAPGTGTPEVAGFSSREIVQLVRGLASVGAVAFDVVEVAPPYDHGDVTSLLAANLAYEMLCTRVGGALPKGSPTSAAASRRQASDGHIS